MGTDPRALPIAETVRFLERFPLPSRPRALEVGCGAGEVALELGRAGWQVKGIDLDPARVATARQRSVDAQQADLLTFESEPFEVVLVTHSLHHISPLEAAVDRLLQLVRPGGWLLVEEHDHAAYDSSTAAWLAERRALLQEAGVLGAGDGVQPLHSHGAQRRRQPSSHHGHDDWHHSHALLHTGAQMRVAIAARFRIHSVEPAPYLYRYLTSELEATARGERLARLVLEQECRALEARQIQPLGLRVAARR